MAHETFFSMGLKIGENETDEEAEMRISKRIFDYSLSQTREIDCNEVENGSNDKFIYFGDRQTLMGSAKAILHLAWMDKWRELGVNNDISYQIIQYGDAEACRKKYGMKISKQYLAYFSPKSEPRVMLVEEDDYLEVDKLDAYVHQHFLMNNPSWSKRALFAVTEL